MMEIVLLIGMLAIMWGMLAIYWGLLEIATAIRNFKVTINQTTQRHIDVGKPTCSTVNMAKGNIHDISKPD